MSYFSTDISDLKIEERKKKLLKHFYQQYKNMLENIEQNLSEDSNFWTALEKLIEMNENNLNVLVCIIDQYKLDRDPSNKIEAIQKIIKEKNKNVKLIVSSSLNDKREKFEYRSFWSFDELEGDKHNYFNKQIDIFNLKEINLDDINKENNKLYEKNYYICPEKSNNKLLDSIILIPDSKVKNEFILLAFQITLKKIKFIL